MNTPCGRRADIVTSLLHNCVHFYVRSFIQLPLGNKRSIARKNGNIYQLFLIGTLGGVRVVLDGRGQFCKYCMCTRNPPLRPPRALAWPDATNTGPPPPTIVYSDADIDSSAQLAQLRRPRPRSTRITQRRHLASHCTHTHTRVWLCACVCVCAGVGDANCAVSAVE